MSTETTSADASTLVQLADIETAARGIAAHVRRTPLVQLARGSAGEGLAVKAENLQLTGSFKIRGAFNAVQRLSDEERAAGVITFSSGNHAQALAYAAAEFAAPCVVVMPDDAQPVKIAATKSLGAEVILVPPAQRKAHAEKLASEHGYSLVPPFDHVTVIAGQGTIGLEIIADAPAVDVVLVPVGGGALASGVATAIKSTRPETRVIGVEPELAADAAASLRSHRLETWSMDVTGRTIADGLRTNLSPLTFDHLHHYLDDLVTVTEDMILDGVGWLARTAHLVVEPSGAVATAAFLYAKDRLPAGRTVAVLSGGNVAPKLLSEAVQRGQ